MGKSSIIGGPFSMVLLNNHRVHLVYVESLPTLGHIWIICRVLVNVQHHCALGSQSVGKNVFIHYICIRSAVSQIFWLLNIFTNLNANPHNPQFIPWLKGKLMMNLAGFQYPISKLFVGTIIHIDTNVKFKSIELSCLQ